MSSSHQETEQVQETEFGGPPLHKEKKTIHFSSGETLELEDSEHEEAEEQSSDRAYFREPTAKTSFSFKNVALLVGRISLLACDFLGERLASALGLNAAKYQYAIDQYNREHKAMKTPGDHQEGQAETLHLSPELGGSRYGATGDMSRPSDFYQSCDEEHVERKEGCHNKGYQAEEDGWK